ncbi:uncharacterized protein PGTG_11836 [Puccinia graminis f. sp. tritici CRL 75-36-700-3]|uniref:CCHC-type domain-containing protein n=1 Tax=Puccinia graminis f. sp. tritici (strain CRL 75-36-700-3 / race SCCL) TaxID=418459 RepID=E3KMF5_PUCGT|nr:uncharacterized protein PGTG_11836 [Puccinia graminis f. sp. tritici CRL 75-36-700-3]EFP85480.2 hypothetical protein PGTG_11836 [Puccinia graminis f. sp. tritici CRL 75-36-700-3]
MSHSEPEDYKTPSRSTDIAGLIAKLTPNAQAARASLEQQVQNASADGRRTLRTLIDPQLPTRPFTSKTSKGKNRMTSIDDIQETVFQPRITGPEATKRDARPTSRQEAHRHMDNPPHLQEKSDIAALITELREQRISDRHCLVKEEERSRKRAVLDEQLKILNVVTSMRKKNLAMQTTSSPVENTPERRFRNACIALGIINVLIHPDLLWDVIRLDAASDVYEKLVYKFRSLSQEAQLNAWNQFININPENTTSTAVLYSEFNDAIKSFVEMEISLTADEIMGLILQSNIKNPTLKSIVDCKVDVLMNARDATPNPHQSHTPSFAELMKILDTARVEMNLENRLKTSETTTFRTLVDTDGGHDEHNTTLSKEVDMLAISKKSHCYICKKEGHIAPNCPVKRRGQSFGQTPQARATNTPYPPSTGHYATLRYLTTNC